MGGWFDTLCEGMGLTKERRGFLIRALWVIIVSGHITWVCGFLGVLGLSTPFATAGDMSAKYQEIAAKQDEAARQTARVQELLQKQLMKSKSTEIREVLLQICIARTSAEKSKLLEKKEDLQVEYVDLNPKGSRYEEPPCEQLR